MISLLLDAAYLVALVIVSPWLVFRAWRHGKYRSGLAAKLWGAVPTRSEPGFCVWWHGVSVGEVNLLVPLIAAARRRHPDWQHVVTTTTRTGYEVAQRRFADCTVCYCPLDFSWAIRRAMRRIRPDLLALAELELWPNLIRTASKRDVPVAVVNGRLSERSFRGYQRLRWALRGTFSRISLVAAQSSDYADRFKAVGVPPDRVAVTGSLKFDGVETNRANPTTAAMSRLAGIDADDVVLLAGSTQAGEEAIALRVFEQLAPRYPRLRLILVPRHPERFAAVASLLDQSGVRWQRRTQLTGENADPQARVLLVDAVGELAAWWGTAQLAFVGGSLGSRGGQNMIEPAAYGAAVSFGPNTRNFRDVVAALSGARAAVVVGGESEVLAFVERGLADPLWAVALGRRAQELVLSQQGATEQTIDLLTQLVGDGPGTGRFHTPHASRAHSALPPAQPVAHRARRLV